MNSLLYSIFLFHLTSPHQLLILSKKSLEKINENIAFNPIGTGPFFISKWKENKEIILKAFSSYWGKQGDLRKIRFKNFPDHTSRDLSLKSEDSDILQNVSGNYIDRLKWTGSVDYHVLKPTNVVFLGFNNNNPPFDNKKVREAFLRAFDSKKYVLNLNRGNAISAKGPLPPIFFNYDLMQQKSTNLDSAKLLLHEAGYNKGLRINFFFPNVAFARKMIIEVIKKDLEKLDIQLDVTLYNSIE